MHTKEVGEYMCLRSIKRASSTKNIMSYQELVPKHIQGVTESIVGLCVSHTDDFMKEVSMRLSFLSMIKIKIVAMMEIL